MKTPERSKQEREDALESALTSLYTIQPPKGFDAAWRAAVQKEERTHMKPFHHARFWKVAAPAFAALLLAVGSILTGTTNLYNQAPGDTILKSQSSSVSYSPTDDYDSQSHFEASMPADMAVYDTESESLPASQGSAANRVVKDENSLDYASKIIRTTNISLATGALDANVADIRQQADTFGGHIENISQFEFPGDAQRALQQISFTLRIPTKNHDMFLHNISGIGRMTSLNENAANLTAEYSDTALRLQTHLEKMKRLQELLIKADNVTDLIEIESAITDNQYTIDAYETELRTIDLQVDNSTVYITLWEESSAQSATEVEVSLGDRLSLGMKTSLRGIGEFLQNMLVFLAMALPVLVPLVVVCVILYLVFRRHRRKFIK